MRLFNWQQKWISLINQSFTHLAHYMVKQVPSLANINVTIKLVLIKIICNWTSVFPNLTIQYWLTWLPYFSGTLAIVVFKGNAYDIYVMFSYTFKYFHKCKDFKYPSEPTRRWHIIIFYDSSHYYGSIRNKCIIWFIAWYVFKTLRSVLVWIVIQLQLRL